MFDFDAGKLIVIGIVALIVIGPKELPGMLRQLGQMMGKLRRMAGEFQGQFMDAMKEAEIDTLKEEAQKLTESVKNQAGFGEINDLNAEIGNLDASIKAEIEDRPQVDPSTLASDDNTFAAPTPSVTTLDLPPVPETPMPEVADFMGEPVAAPAPVPAAAPAPKPVIAHADPVPTLKDLA